MDMNVVVLCGKLAAPPEIREFESGSSLVRLLVTVRTDSPRRRVDVIPVTLWDPDPNDQLLGATVGQQVWVTGGIQRRFWTALEGRRSHLEVVAHHIQHHDGADVPALGKPPYVDVDPGSVPVE